MTFMVCLTFAQTNGEVGTNLIEDIKSAGPLDVGAPHTETRAKAMLGFCVGLDRLGSF